MAEETTETTEVEKVEEQTVPYERFKQANTQAKEAKAAAKLAADQIEQLKQQLEDREHSSLPEMDQLRRRLEAAEKRAEEHERRASETSAALQNTRKERWLMAAASSQNFADPADASAFVNLDDIEDEKDAEAAIKRLAKSKKYLLKPEERQLPGKVMEDGKPVRESSGAQPMMTALQEGLRQFASREALEQAGLK
jgi:hypothetical protein